MAHTDLEWVTGWTVFLLGANIDELIWCEWDKQWQFI